MRQYYEQQRINGASGSPEHVNMFADMTQQ